VNYYLKFVLTGCVALCIVWRGIGDTKGKCRVTAYLLREFWRGGNLRGGIKEMGSRRSVRDAIAGFDLPEGPGSYVLLLSVPQPLEIAAGRLGSHHLPAGLYAYAGSAQGPGGIAARVARHLRQDKRAHWHIDSLTTTVAVARVWTAPGATATECDWVRDMLALPGSSVPVRGFGSTDCRNACPAHLIRLPDDADLDRLEEMLCG
jgi:Uri superfamily endonuclease